MPADKKVASDAPAPAAQPATASETVAVPEKKKSNKTLWIVIGLAVFFLVIVPGLLITVGGVFLKNKLGDKVATNTVESIINKASDGKVSVDSESGSFSVKDENGDTSFSGGANQELPSDFPKSDIPYISEKSVSYVWTSKTDGKKTWSVSTIVSKSVSDANSFFETKIAEPAFTSVSTYSYNDSSTYYGQNTKYTVSATVGKDTDGATTVAYIVTEE